MLEILYYLRYLSMKQDSVKTDSGCQLVELRLGSQERLENANRTGVLVPKLQARYCIP